MSAPSNILRNKTIVLYILENDNNSSQAINLAQNMQDVHIQNVRMLQADKIPAWLDLVPTCITLEEKKVYKGGDALQFLRERLQAMQNTYMRGSGGDNINGGMGGPNNGPPGSNFPHRQQFQRSSSSSGFPPQHRGPQGSNNYSTPQQHSQQQHPQHPQHPQQYPQQQYGGQMRMAPHGFPQSTRNPSQQFPGQFPGQIQGQSPGQYPSQQQNNNMVTEQMTSGGCQPASGSGQMGCSLNDAFRSTEEDISLNDPRFQQSGGISQQDMQRYMQMRSDMEKQRRPPSNSMMPASMQ